MANDRWFNVSLPRRGEVLFEHIAIDHGALCIECKACGRRSLLTRGNCAEIRPGNKRAVKSATFRCSNRACASIETRLYHAHTMDEAEMFRAGDPLPTGREIT